MICNIKAGILKTMLKRVLLFIATNVLVIATISIVTSALGLHGYLSAHGINYQQLMIFCTIWGMGGAFISLFMSRFMAKMAMNLVIIDPHRAINEERFLIDTIYKLATKAGLNTMPEVGIYHSPELNAFATGPSKNKSLVAVSSGLLNSMNKDQLEGVLGHEIAHIANGDMVTMTLIQGVVNAFAMFLSRIAAYAVSIALTKDDERGHDISYLTYGILTFVFDILFTLLGSILVAAFSRAREYRADIGGAHLAGRDNMIKALRKLETGVDVEDDRAPALATLKISGHGRWLELFSTHPPLKERIAKLEQNR
jgi:heat shock protein HtpX